MMFGALALAAVAGCAEERGRPGPPALAIQVPPGSTVFSPDTLGFTIRATDPDGLDSITVTFLDSTASIETDFDSDVSRTFHWPVRSGLPAGRVLPLSARATDLKGLAETQTASVTVISRSVVPSSRR
jgi:hypothetical protein